MAASWDFASEVVGILGGARAVRARGAGAEETRATKAESAKKVDFMITLW